MGKKFYWMLGFYNLKSLVICTECDLSLDNQLAELLYFYWRKNESKNI